VHIERLTSSNALFQTRFEIEIDLDGDFDQREKVILFNSARKCDVSKLLAGEIKFQYQLIE
jgi:uncharacterized OsmC-like protein